MRWFLFWMTMAALAVAVGGALLDRQFGLYAFCAWFILIVLKAVLVVIEATLFGRISFAKGHLSPDNEPKHYWVSLVSSALVLFGVSVIAGAAIWVRLV